MATCKDCVHCRACHEMYLIVVSQEDDFFERHDAETCEDFQNEEDFAEVKRGEWITEENGTVICSECGEEHEWDDFRPPYCDMCGAKNRDDRSDNNVII